MTFEEAKRELKQYTLLGQMQLESINKLKELEERAYSLKSGNDEIERVQTSSYSNTVQNAFERVWEQRTNTAKLVAELSKKQEDIVLKIKRLPSPFADILFKKYVQCKRLEKVCLELNYDYYWLSNLHNRAIKMYSQIL